MNNIESSLLLLLFFELSSIPLSPPPPNPSLILPDCPLLLPFRLSLLVFRRAFALCFSFSFDSAANE